ncbi:glycoside hydrolase family 16 protein [Lanmaoa asiatica]|nr:glycoside hydrolase family 16 protein [Lanmaoa asiatica]
MFSGKPRQRWGQPYLHGDIESPTAAFTPLKWAHARPSDPKFPVHYVSSTTYSLSNSLAGQSFINAFTWATNPDPNWGRVNYVDLATAQSKGLVSVSGNQVTLRADRTTKLTSSGPGRDSFDLVSKIINLTHLIVLTLFICLKVVALGQLFELGSNWPDGGEIDIVEGVNNQSPDLITLHTSANCTMPSYRVMSGTSQGTNCNVYETDNTSCGVSVAAANSFGPSFNSAGGGWYAIERTSSFIKVFFWARKNASIPKDLSSPGSTIDTDNWGTPTAYFPSSINCDFTTHLSPFNIVINLDFCGAWAGNSQLYSAAGCPSTCADYVNSNPSAFQNAYFTFNPLTIYK